MMKVISKRQLKDLIPYSLSHIARLEKAGKFPKRILLGENRVGWIESEVAGWVQERMDRREAT